MKQSTVHRNLETKIKIAGMEAFDLLLILLFAAVMNVLFGKTFLAPWLVFVLPGVVGVVLWLGKRNKPDNYIAHFLKFYTSPGVYSAGEKGKDMGKNNVLSDQIPIRHFDDNLLVFSDGSLGAGFAMEGVDIGSSSKEETDNISERLEGMLTSLPEGITLQVFYRMSPDTGTIIGDHKKIVSHGNKNCQKVASERFKFLRKNQKLGRHFLPTLFLFVKSRPFHYKRASFFLRDARFISATAKDYRTHRKFFERTIKRLESSTDFLKPKRLSAQEWFSLIFEYFNLDRKERIGEPVLRGMDSPFSPPLADQFLLTDVKVDGDSLKIGRYHFAIVTLKNLPEGTTWASMGNLLLGMPVHFWLSQSIHLSDQKMEISKLQLERRVSHSMMSGSRSVRDLESESKFSHTEELISELIEGGEKLVSSDLSVIVWAKSKQELAEKEDEILKVFREMGGAEGVRETLPLFDIYTKIFPGGCGGLRLKKMKSSNAAHLMPVYSWWRGNKKPVCLLPNREGVPFSLDPFAPELPNWNGLIFGGSGSGKSFTVAQLLLQFCGQKPAPKVVWIDNGASSKHLTEVLDGEFVDLKLDSGICINMFELGAGEKAPDDSKVKLILAVLESILKEEGRQGIPKREKALLEESILKSYAVQNRETPKLSDLKNLLTGHKVQEMRFYGDILSAWTGQSAYGKILDGETNIRPENNLVSFELKGLDGYPDLQNVLMLILTDFIKREASKDLSTPCLLIIDEGWKLFETTNGLGFAVEAFRTFRKYNAGIWCISQNYRDFLADEEVKNALLPNAASLFILRQKKIDWNDFKDTFDFNDEEIAVIKSLHFEKGVYSEFFYMQEDNKAVLRLIPDPLSYWICTTNGEDKARIEEEVQKHPERSMLEIMNTMSKESTG